MYSNTSIVNLLSARPIVLPCATPHKANTGIFRGAIFHVNYLCPQLMGPHLATNCLGLRLDFTGVLPQGHVKVIWRSNKLKYWIKTFFTVFCYKGVFHKAATVILWLGIFPARIPGGTVNIIWLGGVIPHSYIPRPLLYHTLYQH